MLNAYVNKRIAKVNVIITGIWKQYYIILAKLVSRLKVNKILTKQLTNYKSEVFIGSIDKHLNDKNI